MLTAKSHDKLEHEYEMAFQAISSLLREFYGISSVIPVLSIRKYLVELKPALNASLEITKHEMLDKLQQSLVPFYMVTICCDDPEAVELTKVEQEDCIERMRNAQSNILNIDFGRRNFRSTPRIMPA